MAGEDNKVKRTQLPALLCEVNSGIALRCEDEELVLQHLDKLSPGVQDIDINLFESCIEYWYINTSTSSVVFPSEVSERAIRAVKPVRPTKAALVPSQIDTKEKQLVLETFARYDKSGEGVIKADELREMMADLNSGIYPTDQEVQHVMWFADTKQHGYLDVYEFEAAVTFWYIHTMEERERVRSHCCVVL
eukprot:TRINITY_DN4765_c0_g1_i2.p1 TRINITY_DN4765_c0_g1~~TRINITY_DN4765_c0_g1_i2.p1  ORF type:complete len:191 (+),score=56.74 TRINITY_DN4765_c0_g1_i2:316-888(+)